MRKAKKTTARIIGLQVAAKVERILQRKRLTKMGVSVKAGHSKDWLSMLLGHFRKGTFTVSSLVGLADILGVDAAELFLVP